MMIVYQKDCRDASEISREMKIIFHGGFFFRNLAGGDWSSTPVRGLK